MSGAWIAAFLALWAVVLLLGLLVLGLLRRIGPVLERAEFVASSAVGPGIGLPLGTTVPDFELSLANGEAISAADLRGRPYVLLFVSSGCAPCRGLAAEIRTREGPAPLADLIVVAAESDADAALTDAPYATLAFQSGRAVSDAFGTSATPHAFAVDTSGTVVASSFPNTLDHLEALAREASRGGDRQTSDARDAVVA